MALRDDTGLPVSVDLNGQHVFGELEATIPPSGLRVFETDGTGDLVTGSVTVSSDLSLAGVILFGGTVGVAGVGNSTPLSSAFLAPMEVRATDQVNTGMAIMNLLDERVLLDFELFDPQGNLLAGAQSELPTRGHMARYLTELAWDPEVDFSDFEGLLRITPSDSVAGTVIQTRPNQFATMPVTPE